MNSTGTAASHSEIKPEHRRRTRTLVLRGLPTQWYEEGPTKAPLVVFLHGYPDTPEVWNPQVEALRDQFECVRPFARGLLETDENAPRSRYDLDSQLLDLMAIINEKCSNSTRPIFLVGHDLGGVLALHLAGALGPRLAGVAILNSVSLPQMWQRLKTKEQLFKSWYILAFQIPILSDLFVKRFPELILQAKKKIPGLRDIEVTADQLSRPLQTYRAFVKEAVTHPNAKPPRIAAPLLVLWGNRDPFLVTPQWSEWERLSSEITFRILEAGHWLQWQKSEAVNLFLNNFFAEHSE